MLIVSDGKGKAADVSDNLLKLPSDWDSKGFPWGKIKAIETVFDQLADITHVFWLDADIVLTNLRVGLEWLALLDFSLVTSGDESGINTGALMRRSDAFSRNLLRRTWELYPSFALHPCFEQGAMIGVIMSNLSVTGSTGMPWQAEADLAQQAFHAATMTAETPACIARLNARLPPSSKDSVLLVPQCLFGRRPDTWATGSFAVHFAGRGRGGKVCLFFEYESKVLRDDERVAATSAPPFTPTRLAIRPRSVASGRLGGCGARPAPALRRAARCAYDEPPSARRGGLPPALRLPGAACACSSGPGAHDSIDSERHAALWMCPMCWQTAPTACVWGRLLLLLLLA